MIDLPAHRPGTESLAKAEAKCYNRTATVEMIKGRPMDRVELPLASLTLAQKLDLIETLWADISKDEQQLESPTWHGEVLRDRQKALEAGKATVHDWQEAKERIKRNVS